MVSAAQIGFTSLIGQAAGTGLQVAGNLMKGQSESSMFKYQAGVAKINADIAKQNEVYALHTGEKTAIKHGMAAAQRKGTIVTQQSASGLNVTKGSARQVQESQDLVDRADQVEIRESAARKAYGFNIEAKSQEQKAKMYEKSAKSAKTASYINAATSLISGATSVSSKWLQGNDAGLWGGSTGEDYDWEFDLYGPGAPNMGSIY